MVLIGAHVHVTYCYQHPPLIIGTTDMTFFSPCESKGVSMNNLNDPPNWNIQPNPRENGGDGNKWNYALLVPMLGLAAFRK